MTCSKADKSREKGINMTYFSKRSRYKHKQPALLCFIGFNLSLFTAQISSHPLKFYLLLPIIEFQIQKTFYHEHILPLVKKIH